MKSPLFTGSPCPGQRSAVLIIVLAFLVFLCLIIVSLTVALQTESSAAHYFAARNSADLLAQQGVEYVRAALLTAEQPTNGWATAPGLIYYWPTNTTVASAVALSLSSGPTNGTASGIYASPDLNRLVYSEDSLTAITGASTTNEMSVGWIYVYQNGNETTNQSPTISSANPIIGRFAYWADDESSRVNFNTAYLATGNTNSLNHPSRIDLTGLFGNTFAQQIYTNALVACFNSPDDARRLNSDLGPMISTNRFSLTHDSYSQDLNPWGQPKIILTTQQSVAGAGNTNFLNILNTPNEDPGLLANCNTNTLVPAEINLISSYLTNNWPGFGTSFAQKYGPTTASQTQTANQMALDIIDYVRSTESTNVLCEPLRGNLTGTTFDQSSAGTESLSSLFGTSRHPLITEVACWIEKTPTYFNTSKGIYEYRYFVSIELYLPTGYGVSSISVPGTQVDTLVLQENDLSDSLTISSTAPTPSATTTTNLPVTWVSAGATGGVLNAGQYCVITAEYDGGANGASVDFPNGQYPGRVSFKDSNGVLWDVAPVGFGSGTVPGTGIPIPINNVEWPSNNEGNIMEINDPRVNKYAGDWSQQEGDTMGSKPLQWLTAFSATPPQDTAAATVGGAPSSNSLYFPAPGSTVQSVADLGRVTTGVNISAAGIPWRSVRLQPTPASFRKSPPDWALLDLFQAPYSSTNRSDLYQPETNNGAGLVSMAGLVNINSSLTPFTNNPTIIRAVPLLALLTNAPTANQVFPETNLVPAYAATNIGAMTMSANGTNYGVPVFVSSGELAEVKGMADGGESTESNLRGVVDLATVRGSTFRVYSIGQTLKQTPAGVLVLQAEQYKEAIILQDSLNHHVSVLWKNISQ